MKQGTGSAKGFLSWRPGWFTTAMILDRVFPLFPGNFHLGGEWLPSYLHEKYISGEALIVTWPKNLVYNWVAPGSLLPKPLQHPRPIIDVASLDGGKSSEKYEVETFQPQSLHGCTFLISRPPVVNRHHMTGHGAAWHQVPSTLHAGSGNGSWLDVWISSWKVLYKNQYL